MKIVEIVGGTAALVVATTALTFLFLQTTPRADRGGYSDEQTTTAASEIRKDYETRGEKVVTVLMLRTSTHHLAGYVTFGPKRPGMEAVTLTCDGWMDNENVKHFWTCK
jgi:hypothetical protein